MVECGFPAGCGGLALIGRLQFGRGAAHFIINNYCNVSALV